MNDDKKVQPPSPYESIINLPHYVSAKRTPMSMEARAAQFAPFAALSGHDAAIAETGRRTSSPNDLSLDEMHDLSRKLTYAMSLPEPPTIEITYFKPDDRKVGGSYVTVIGNIKKVEECFGLLTFTELTAPDVPTSRRRSIEIPLAAISAITGSIFTDLF